jgi:hypothetical protein
MNVRSRWTLLLLIVGLFSAGGVRGQATILQDVTAEIRVVAHRDSLTLPPFGIVSELPVFTIVEGEQALIRVEVRGSLAVQPVPTFPASVVWMSSDSAVLEVVSVNGDGFAQVRALPGSAGKSARLLLSVFLRGVGAGTGDAFALFYAYTYPTAYECVRMTVPPFLSATGRSLFFEVPDFAQGPSLEGCTAFQPPAPPVPVYSRVLVPTLTGPDAGGAFEVAIHLLDAQGAPVAGVEVTVEPAGGATWGNGTTTARTNVTDAQGFVGPGRALKGTGDGWLAITASGAKSLSITIGVM